MVTTRGFKRRNKDEEEKAAAATAIVVQHILGFNHLGFTSHQGNEAQTPVNVSSAESLTRESQGNRTSSYLETSMAEVEVNPPVRPCSLPTSGRYPYHYRSVPRKRNKSTASIGAVKKDITDHAVAHGTNVNASLSQIHHSTDDIHALPAIGCIQSVSASPFEPMDVNDVPILNEDKSLQQVNRPVVEGARQETSLDLSAVDALDDDGSSVDSDISSALVTVGGYRVKENLAPILRGILSKYGDIAADCRLKSITLRSVMVENVCDIVQKLQAVEFVHLTPVEIDKFRTIVQDIESDNVNVGWLLHRLNEIREAKRHLKESSKVKQAKTQSRRAIEEIEVEIEEKEEEIKGKEEEIASAKKELELRREELELQREEERKLDEILSNTKVQVKRFHCGSMIDGLLT